MTNILLLAILTTLMGIFGEQTQSTIVKLTTTVLAISTVLALINPSVISA